MNHKVLSSAIFLSCYASRANKGVLEPPCMEFKQIKSNTLIAYSKMYTLKKKSPTCFALLYALNWGCVLKNVALSIHTATPFTFSEIITIVGSFQMRYMTFLKYKWYWRYNAANFELLVFVGNLLSKSNFFFWMIQLWCLLFLD